ncbi:ABC transporter permease [Hymenobacter jejuensis]|nr:ABC transporter permease [Hymenobacter jejuensis]
MAVASSLAPVVRAAPPARPPSYYVRQRLLQNGPAMAGLAFIVLCTLIALAGYWVLPDNSPNANNSVVQLQKEPPGFDATILRLPPSSASRQVVANQDNIFTTWWRGRELRYQEVPVSGYRIVGDSVVIEPYRNHSALPDQPRRYALAALTGKDGSAENQKQVIDSEIITKRTYWLGTDKSGRDELSRLLLGTRISLGIGLVAVLISLALGMLVGAVAGYVGGWVDSVLMGVMTVVWSIPGIMLVIAISLALDSKGVWTSFVAVGLTMWVDVARVVRGQMLSLREKTFVEAGRVLGLPQSRLIWRHLLPNMTGPLIVLATSNFAAAILLEAGLSFLGLGVQPPAPSWGLMVNEGFQLIGTQAGLWLTLLPGTAISLLVLSFNLLGNGLRDAYDPKTPIAG